MYLATIRSTARISLTAVAASLEAAVNDVKAQVPDGYELISAMPTMSKDSVELTVNALCQSMDTRELTGDSLDAIRAQTPDGWQVLSLR